MHNFTNFRNYFCYVCSFIEIEFSDIKILMLKSKLKPCVDIYIVYDVYLHINLGEMCKITDNKLVFKV